MKSQFETLRSTKGRKLVQGLKRRTDTCSSATDGKRLLYVKLISQRASRKNALVRDLPGPSCSYGDQIVHDSSFLIRCSLIL